MTTNNETNEQPAGERAELLLKEMRYIAGISTGQVKRVAEAALKNAALLEADAQRPKLTSDQSVTSDYMEWANDRDSVGGNEAWNAGVEWAKAQRPAMKPLMDEQIEIEIAALWRAFGDDPRAALEMAVRGLRSIHNITGEAQPVGKMQIEWNQSGRAFFHVGCDKNSFGSGIMQQLEDLESGTVFKCLHCGKRGVYPAGGVGEICVDIL